MPDPLSTPTGIVTLIGATLKCSLESRDLISDLRHAPKSVKTLIDDVRSCRAIVRRLERIYKQLLVDGHKDIADLHSQVEKIDAISKELRRRIGPYLIRRGLPNLTLTKRFKWR